MPKLCVFSSTFDIRFITPGDRCGTHGAVFSTTVWGKTLQSHNTLFSGLEIINREQGEGLWLFGVSLWGNAQNEARKAALSCTGQSKRRFLCLRPLSHCRMVGDIRTPDMSSFGNRNTTRPIPEGRQPRSPRDPDRITNSIILKPEAESNHRLVPCTFFDT